MYKLGEKRGLSIDVALHRPGGYRKRWFCYARMSSTTSSTSRPMPIRERKTGTIDFEQVIEVRPSMRRLSRQRLTSCFGLLPTPSFPRLQMTPCMSAGCATHNAADIAEIAEATGKRRSRRQPTQRQMPSAERGAKSILKAGDLMKQGKVVESSL